MVPQATKCRRCVPVLATPTTRTHSRRRLQLNFHPDDLREHDKSFQLPEHGIPLDQATVRKHLNASQKALRKLQSSSTDLRIKSYQDLVAAYDADTNHRTIPESRRKAKIANRTIQSEARKRLFGLLRQVVKPSEFSALAKLQIPRSSEATGITPPDNVHQVLKHTSPDNLIWDTIIDKQDIESHLLQYNREAFRAAAESPCGHGLIHDALTFTSLSPDAAALLQGDSKENYLQNGAETTTYCENFWPHSRFRTPSSRRIPFQRTSPKQILPEASKPGASLHRRHPPDDT